MEPKNDRTQSGQPRPAGAPAPRRRFRLQRLEERIAPKGGNGTHKCGGGSGTSGGTGTCACTTSY